MRLHPRRTNHPTGRPTGRPAFSLIELLVVIAIIALLSGMLLVAIAHAFKAVKYVKSLVTTEPPTKLRSTI